MRVGRVTFIFLFEPGKSMSYYLLEKRSRCQHTQDSRRTH